MEDEGGGGAVRSKSDIYSLVVTHPPTGPEQRHWDSLANIHKIKFKQFSRFAAILQSPHYHYFSFYMSL